VADAQILAGLAGAVVSVSAEESIGFHCARRMRELGARVAITHRPARAEAAPALREACGAELALPLDTDDEPQVEAAFAAMNRAFGRLDFLIHTVMHVPAGALAAPFSQLRREDFHDTLDAGAYSLVVVARRALPLLSRSSSPRIVAISSACGERFTPSYHVAGVAKAALESCLVYLAYELGPLGILCNAVSPSLLASDGAVRTVGRANATGTRAHLAKKSATRHAVEYAEVADTVAFFASPLCRNTTAEVLTIDGGYAKSYF